MKGFYDAIILLVVVTLLLPEHNATPAIPSPGTYSDPTQDQFHIQTDEGPERYFRYQTQSGQYRKEKRLEDGTVVGSYGWIDSTGLLRLQDYIADNAGYRILRTKDIYVGRNRPISQAIKAAKKIPGVVGSSIPVAPVGNPSVYLPPVSSTTPSPITSTPSFLSTTYNPRVDISHNSYPGVFNGYSTTPSPVSSTILPPPVTSTPSPFQSTTVSSLPSSTAFVSPTPTPGTVVISPKVPYPTAHYLPSVSSTPSPFITSISSTPIPSPSPVFITTHRPAYNGLFLSTTPSPLGPIGPNYGSLSSTPHPLNIYDSPTLTPQINSNALDDFYDSNENPYIHHNGPTYPIDRHGNSYFGRARPQNRQPPPTNGYIGNGYDPQYPQYNGVSVTNDGFRYYIPRAYHEEQDTGYSKSGSFGYIDPFGIRRVVYYNAGADGFQHRKNNRYVGFNATPYDPRPYKKRK